MADPRSTGAHGRFPPGFDPTVTLTGETIRVRPLVEGDREPLFTAIADPLIWEQHPAKDRATRAGFEPYLDFLLATGGSMAVEEVGGAGHDHRVIGTSTFYGEPPDGTAEGSADATERPSVGFTFLTREHWGQGGKGGTNFELKRLMLDHLFPHTPAVWLHIAPGNARSQRATAKLGAVHERDATLNTTGTASLAQCWRLDRAAWERTKATRAGAKT